ncbi:glutamate--tRNA ligase [Paractinoplanes hotanensis]|uniref:Glutamate--tRNA ligase family protein n=1 Tax=Paractinoplanes hotanensis TaxID=2906497 RepID=A0ABT0YCM6_9ACTN|nr:glutamate--tRNA ligase family protein [Actinoplanes hotanensis]MCM4083550.1 glutamate--tRNA ligase family protein [Actinoplanes hotanensis]
MPSVSFVDSLFPADLPEPSHWEQRYPPRGLPPDAMVTRFCPSPTGPLHIGGIYVALIDRSLADAARGRYLLRVEDTDQAREVPGVRDQFERAFTYFGLPPDESDVIGGAYGPYLQSRRAEIYLSYVRDLMRRGHAYLCFATREELAEQTAAQQAAKVPTGYYGRWAIWRDAPQSKVGEALAVGRPYVVRFRSEVAPGERISYVDAIRGRIEFDANRNDVVILKSSDQPLPLPTYHLAHTVDDHLMRVNLVLRADEWLSSVPLHLQLFDALGFDRLQYAHIAPLLKLDRGNKRKLSKRKDPEASVDFYLRAGYPPEPVLAYLRGLINGRLADIPEAEALAAPIRLDECGVSGSLVDMVKLEGISADHVAAMSGVEILAAVTEWARQYDPELAEVLAAEPDLAVRALAVERDGVDKPRKDLRKWSDFRAVYGFFFPQLFTPVTSLHGGPLENLPAEVVRAMADSFSATYQPLPDAQEWFGQIRSLAAENGFAATPKEHKARPDLYHGSIREASQIIRVALTGSTRSPDLYAVASAMGPAEVRRRVAALAAT